MYTVDNKTVPHYIATILRASSSLSGLELMAYYKIVSFFHISFSPFHFSPFIQSYNAMPRTENISLTFRRMQKYNLQKANKNQYITVKFIIIKVKAFRGLILFTYTPVVSPHPPKKQAQ